MVYILVHNSGKAHSGVFWAEDRGALYARLQLMALLLNIGSLFLLMPLVGVMGAVLALFIQMVVFRASLQWWVRKWRRIPFQDGWVLFGSAIILATLGISWYFHFGLKENVLLLIGAWSLLVFFSRRIFKEVFKNIYS